VFKTNIVVSTPRGYSHGKYYGCAIVIAIASAKSRISQIRDFPASRDSRKTPDHARAFFAVPRGSDAVASTRGFRRRTPRRRTVRVDARATTRPRDRVATTRSIAFDRVIAIALEIDASRAD